MSHGGTDPESLVAAARSCDEDERERDRRELNDALKILADLFPDVRTEVFRELLRRFDGESRLHVCVEQLLRYRSEWVGGRWNVADPQRTGPELTAGFVPIEEQFRSESYKEAVRGVLALEFSALGKSTISAVLAEVNFSYVRSRPILKDLNSKSWRDKLESFFSFIRPKKKILNNLDHPLLVWPKSGGPIPELKRTHNEELDRELHELLLAPLIAAHRNELDQSDRLVAEELNQAEARDADAMYECACCLDDVTFEQISTCSTHLHPICCSCIRRTTSEALFGQGWSKSVDVQRSTLRCLAPMSHGMCDGNLDPLIVKRAILTERAGQETYAKFETRLATDALLKSQMQLIHCPFCSYAEFDPVYHPSPEGIRWRFRRVNFANTILVIILLIDLLPILFLPLLFLLILCPSVFRHTLSTSFHNICLKWRTQRFVCRNPACGRHSCISCHKPWRDPHFCHEPLLLSLRTTIEAARTAAVKRTCPQCGLSFVKSSGCNKLTCVCGYSMCYVCRKALGNRKRHPVLNREQGEAAVVAAVAAGAAEVDEEPEGYRHFCEHFRVDPGTKCTECTKCDLYQSEDEEAVARQAGEEAERQWRERQGSLVGGASSAGAVPHSASVYAAAAPAFGPGEAYTTMGNLHIRVDSMHEKTFSPFGYGYANWLEHMLALGVEDWYRLLTRDLWRDGRWKREGQRLVDAMMEVLVVVDV